METQNNELILNEDLMFTHDSSELDFEGNFENKIMELNPYEDEGVIHESCEPINACYTPLSQENNDEKIVVPSSFENQDVFYAKLYEAPLAIHVEHGVVVPVEAFQEYSKYFHMKEYYF
jgi:hypothetical protein